MSLKRTVEIDLRVDDNRLKQTMSRLDKQITAMSSKTSEVISNRLSSPKTIGQALSKTIPGAEAMGQNASLAGGLSVASGFMGGNPLLGIQALLVKTGWEMATSFLEGVKKAQENNSLFALGEQMGNTVQANLVRSALSPEQQQQVDNTSNINRAILNSVIDGARSDIKEQAAQSASVSPVSQAQAQAQIAKVDPSIQEQNERDAALVRGLVQNTETPLSRDNAMQLLNVDKDELDDQISQAEAKLVQLDQEANNLTKSVIPQGGYNLEARERPVSDEDLKRIIQQVAAVRTVVDPNNTGIIDYDKLITAVRTQNKQNLTASESAAVDVINTRLGEKDTELLKAQSLAQERRLTEQSLASLQEARAQIPEIEAQVAQEIVSRRTMEQAEEREPSPNRRAIAVERREREALQLQQNNAIQRVALITAQRDAYIRNQNATGQRVDPNVLFEYEKKIKDAGEAVNSFTDSITDADNRIKALEESGAADVTRLSDGSYRGSNMRGLEHTGYFMAQGLASSFQSLRYGDVGGFAGGLLGSVSPLAGIVAQRAASPVGTVSARFRDRADNMTRQAEGESNVTRRRMLQLSAMGASGVATLTGGIRSVGVGVGGVLSNPQVAMALSQISNTLGSMLQQAFLAPIRMFSDRVTQGLRDFEVIQSSLMQISIVTNQAGTALDGLKDTIVQAGIESSKSTAEISRVALQLVRSGFAIGGVGENFNKLLLGVVRLSEATGQDLGVAGQAIGTFQNMFKRSAIEVADALVVAANNVDIGMDKLVLALSHGGSVMVAAGQSLESSLAITSTLSRMGMSPYTAGTAMKNVVSRIVAPRGPGAGEVQQSLRDLAPVFRERGMIGQNESIVTSGGQLRVPVEELIGPLYQALMARGGTQLIQQVFGAQAEGPFRMLASQGNALLQQMNASFAQGPGLTTFSKERMLYDTLEGAFKFLQGSVDTLNSLVGSSLAGAVSAGVFAVSRFTNAIIDAGDSGFLSTLSDLSATFTGVIAQNVGLFTEMGEALEKVINKYLGNMGTALENLLLKLTQEDTFFKVIDIVKGLVESLLWLSTKGFSAFATALANLVVTIYDVLETIKARLAGDWWGKDSERRVLRSKASRDDTMTSAQRIENRRDIREAIPQQGAIIQNGGLTVPNDSPLQQYLVESGASSQELSLILDLVSQATNDQGEADKTTVIDVIQNKLKDLYPDRDITEQEALVSFILSIQDLDAEALGQVDLGDFTLDNLDKAAGLNSVINPPGLNVQDLVKRASGAYALGDNDDLVSEVLVPEVGGIASPPSDPAVAQQQEQRSTTANRIGTYLQDITRENPNLRILSNIETGLAFGQTSMETSPEDLGNFVLERLSIDPTNLDMNSAQAQLNREIPGANGLTVRDLLNLSPETQTDQRLLREELQNVQVEPKVLDALINSGIMPMTAVGSTSASELDPTSRMYNEKLAKQFQDEINLQASLFERGESKGLESRINREFLAQNEGSFLLEQAGLGGVNEDDLPSEIQRMRDTINSGGEVPDAQREIVDKYLRFQTQERVEAAEVVRAQGEALRAKPIENRDFEMEFTSTTSEDGLKTEVQYTEYEGEYDTRPQDLAGKVVRTPVTIRIMATSDEELVGAYGFTSVDLPYLQLTFTNLKVDVANMKPDTMVSGGSKVGNRLLELNRRPRIVMEVIYPQGQESQFKEEIQALRDRMQDINDWELNQLKQQTMTETPSEVSRDPTKDAEFDIIQNQITNAREERQMELERIRSNNARDLASLGLERIAQSIEVDEDRMLNMAQGVIQGRSQYVRDLVQQIQDTQFNLDALLIDRRAVDFETDTFQQGVNLERRELNLEVTRRIDGGANSEDGLSMPAKDEVTQTDNMALVQQVRLYKEMLEGDVYASAEAILDMYNSLTTQVEEIRQRAAEELSKITKMFLEVGTRVEGLLSNRSTEALDLEQLDIETFLGSYSENMSTVVSQVRNARSQVLKYEEQTQDLTAFIATQEAQLTSLERDISRQEFAGTLKESDVQLAESLRANIAKLQQGLEFRTRNYEAYIEQVNSNLLDSFQVSIQSIIDSYQSLIDNLAQSGSKLGSELSALFSDRMQGITMANQGEDNYNQLIYGAPGIIDQAAISRRDINARRLQVAGDYASRAPQLMLEINQNRIQRETVVRQQESTQLQLDQSNPLNLEERSKLEAELAVQQATLLQLDLESIKLQEEEESLKNVALSQMRQLNAEYGVLGTVIGRTMTGLRDSIGGAFKGMFSELFSLTDKSFSEILESFTVNVLNAIAQAGADMLYDMTVQPLLDKLFGSVFGDIIGGTGEEQDPELMLQESIKELGPEFSNLAAALQMLTDAMNSLNFNSIQETGEVKSTLEQTIERLRLEPNLDNLDISTEQRESINDSPDIIQQLQETQGIEGVPVPTDFNRGLMTATLGDLHNMLRQVLTEAGLPGLTVEDVTRMGETGETFLPGGTGSPYVNHAPQSSTPVEPLLSEEQGTTGARVPLEQRLLRSEIAQSGADYAAHLKRKSAGYDAHITGVQEAPVYSPAPGKVLSVTEGNARAGGQVVKVQYEDGSTAEFIHLIEVSVSPGDFVTEGTAIGTYGHVGQNSTGGHLHFETMDPNGVMMDPEVWYQNYFEHLETNRNSIDPNWLLDTMKPVPQSSTPEPVPQSSTPEPVSEQPGTVTTSDYPIPRNIYQSLDYSSLGVNKTDFTLSSGPGIQVLGNGGYTGRQVPVFATTRGQQTLNAPEQVFLVSSPNAPESQEYGNTGSYEIKDLGNNTLSTLSNFTPKESLTPGTLIDQGKVLGVLEVGGTIKTTIELDNLGYIQESIVTPKDPETPNTPVSGDTSSALPQTLNVPQEPSTLNLDNSLTSPELPTLVASTDLSQVIPSGAEVPEIEVPGAEVPEIEVPGAEVPEIEVPEIEVPGAEVPEIEVPDNYLNPMSLFTIGQTDKFALPLNKFNRAQMAANPSIFNTPVTDFSFSPPGALSTNFSQGQFGASSTLSTDISQAQVFSPEPVPGSFTQPLNNFKVHPLAEIKEVTLSPSVSLPRVNLEGSIGGLSNNVTNSLFPATAPGIQASTEPMTRFMPVQPGGQFSIAPGTQPWSGAQNPGVGDQSQIPPLTPASPFDLATTGLSQLGNLTNLVSQATGGGGILSYVSGAISAISSILSLLNPTTGIFATLGALFAFKDGGIAGSGGKPLNRQARVLKLNTGGMLDMKGGVLHRPSVIPKQTIPGALNGPKQKKQVNMRYTDLAKVPGDYKITDLYTTVEKNHEEYVLPFTNYTPGGVVHGRELGSGDIIPALLEPGEAVLNRRAVSLLGGVDIVQGLNRNQLRLSRTQFSMYNMGGMVTQSGTARTSPINTVGKVSSITSELATSFIPLRMQEGGIVPLNLNHTVPKFQKGGIVGGARSPRQGLSMRLQADSDTSLTSTYFWSGTRLSPTTVQNVGLKSQFNTKAEGQARAEQAFLQQKPVEGSQLSGLSIGYFKIGEKNFILQDDIPGIVDQAVSLTEQRMYHNMGTVHYQSKFMRR